MIAFFFLQLSWFHWLMLSSVNLLLSNSSKTSGPSAHPGNLEIYQMTFIHSYCVYTELVAYNRFNGLLLYSISVNCDSEWTVIIFGNFIKFYSNLYTLSIINRNVVVLQRSVECWIFLHLNTFWLWFECNIPCFIRLFGLTFQPFFPDFLVWRTTEMLRLPSTVTLMRGSSSCFRHRTQNHFLDSRGPCHFGLEQFYKRTGRTVEDWPPDRLFFDEKLVDIFDRIRKIYLYFEVCGVLTKLIKKFRNAFKFCEKCPVLDLSDCG